MLSICCEFGDNCNVVFNHKKTVCIKFGDKVNVNKLISKFGHLQPDVLINLFNTYCCSFYIWIEFVALAILHPSGFKSCLTAWNIGARKVLNIPYRAHTWMLGPLMNSIHVKDKLYIRDLKFIYNMKISDYTYTDLNMLNFVFYIN